MEGDFPLQPGETLQEQWIQMLHLVKKDHTVCYQYYLFYTTFLKASLTYSDTHLVWMIAVSLLR